MHISPDAAGNAAPRALRPLRIDVAYWRLADMDRLANVRLRGEFNRSTDRCNTFCELPSRRLIEQGLSRPFIELPCDGTELGLAVQGQIGATGR